jgi:hypothetical protein
MEKRRNEKKSASVSWIDLSEHEKQNPRDIIEGEKIFLKFTFTSPLLIFILLSQLLILYIPDRYFYALFGNQIGGIHLAENFAKNITFYDRAYISFFIVLVSLILCPLLTKKAMFMGGRRIALRVSGNFKKALSVILVLIIVFIGFFILIFVNSHDPSYCTGCTNKFKLGFFVFYGILLPGAIPQFLMGVIICAKEIYRNFRRIR